jgi:hypothetical protein
MKRILFILAIAVLVGGCNTVGLAGGTSTIGGEYTQGRGYEFSYKGHQYIRFTGFDDWGVVHDPDCPCHHQVAQTLSEWDKLILAISYTESRWNPDAVGSNHDSGHLQLTKPYLSEINRIYKTDYTLEDAFDPETAIKLFTMMQEHYNKEHDIQSAIYHHNKAGYYRDAVMENMALVERYEAIRKILIEYEHK